MFEADTQKLGAIKDFLAREEETEQNIKIFAQMLELYGRENISNVLTFSFDEPVHVNLAGVAFMNTRVKSKLLDSILQIAPELLTTEYYSSFIRSGVSKPAKGHYHSTGARLAPTTLKLTTPLRMAVKNRNPIMVAQILEHPIFLAAMNSKVEVICDQIFTTYMYALRWYDQTAPGEVAARQMAGQLTITAEEFEQRQQQVLGMLLAGCKQAMAVARNQNVYLLPKNLMKTFIFDGMAGERFTTHGKLGLVNRQLTEMLEICKSYYASEMDLQQAQSEGFYPNTNAIAHLMSLQLLIAKPETVKAVDKFLEVFGKILGELDPALLHEFLNIEGMANNTHTGWGKALMPFVGYIQYNNKPQFLSCIQGFESKLSKETNFKLLVHNRDLRILAIAGTPFSTIMAQNIENTCDKLIRSYMWALAWYHKDKEASGGYSSLEELLNAQNDFQLNIPTAKEKLILQVLSSACKKAMAIAGNQGKNRWFDSTISIIYMEGVLGDGFLQHTSGGLLEYQKKELGEIFEAFCHKDQKAEQDNATAQAAVRVLTTTPEAARTTVPPLSSSPNNNTVLTSTYQPRDYVMAVVIIACALFIRGAIGVHER